jgi:hypothetical protein
MRLSGEGGEKCWAWGMALRGGERAMVVRKGVRV